MIMKNNNKNICVLLTIIAISIGSTMPAFSQAYLYGPSNPPPKTSSISSSHPEGDGQIGRAGGMVYTIQNITLANTTTVYWTTLDNSVKLSMDGNTYSDTENMTISSAQTNLIGGIITWTGLTRMPLANGGSQILKSKFITMR